jgi:hypothetical protein
MRGGRRSEGRKRYYRGERRGRWQRVGDEGIVGREAEETVGAVREEQGVGGFGELAEQSERHLEHARTEANSARRHPSQALGYH